MGEEVLYDPHRLLAYRSLTVPDPSPVRRVVLVTVDGQEGESAGRDLGDVGHEVVGDTLRILPYEAAWMCSHGVEVAQDADVPILNTKLGHIRYEGEDVRV